MAKGNALQAVLDRAKAGGGSAPAPATPTEATTARAAAASRQGTKLIGGHFAPEVSTQLRILAAEEGTTMQRLLAARKGKVMPRDCKGTDDDATPVGRGAGRFVCQKGAQPRRSRERIAVYNYTPIRLHAAGAPET